jgi:hypothetical protein
MNVLITPRLFFGLESSSPVAILQRPLPSPCLDFANFALIFKKPEIPDEIDNRKERKPECSTLTTQSRIAKHKETF